MQTRGRESDEGDSNNHLYIHFLHSQACCSVYKYYLQVLSVYFLLQNRLYVIKLAGGLLFFLPFPYFVAVFSLLYITLHYWGHYSLLYSTYVRFMVAGGDLFVTPPLWHPASVAVRSLS